MYKRDGVFQGYEAHCFYLNWPLYWLVHSSYAFKVKVVEIQNLTLFDLIQNALSRHIKLHAQFAVPRRGIPKASVLIYQIEKD
jgi:hypothetical protein